MHATTNQVPSAGHGTLRFEVTCGEWLPTRLGYSIKGVKYKCANLALSTALALRDSDNDSNNNTTKQHHNLFRVLYLLHGPYSPDLLNSTSMKMFGNLEFGLTYAQMKFVMNQTFRNSSDYKTFSISLLAENLSGLPPIYIAAMALDPLMIA